MDTLRVKPQSHALRSALGRILALLLAVTFVCCPARAFAAEAPTVTAEGAFVLDFNTGEVYYQKNADTPRHAASMTKVMSVYLVFEEIKAGRLALTTPIRASAYAAKISNDPDYSGMENLAEGASYPVDTLLRLIMTASANASIIALAEHISGSESAFVARMNAKAVEWGVSAHYADCTGFKDDGNAVSPRAMAEIARRTISDHPEILNYSSLKSTVFQGETFYTTNKLLREGRFEGIDGLKTGTTTRAGYCFTGTALRNGRRIISVVMSSASSAARVTDSEKLLEFGFALRTEKEQRWPVNTSALAVQFSTASGALTPFSSNELHATVTGLGGGPVPCGVNWEFGGTSYQMGTSTLSEGSTLSLTATPPYSAGNVPVALSLSFPDGHTEKREGSIPMGEPLSFTGAMGVTEVSLYPGNSLRIPCVLRCEQGVTCSVPMSWFLDGKPIPNYQNPSFQCTPSGYSGYTLNADKLTPGSHVLELRCNPDGLPGIVPTSFSTTINILELSPELTFHSA